MHLISVRNLRIDAAQFPDVKKQVEDWYATVRKAEWKNLEDVRLIYRDAFIGREFYCLQYKR